jgi:thioredoxin-like negative regulator of GroEL
MAENPFFFRDSKHVKELKDKDFSFDGGVWRLKNNVCTAVLFYAPWCRHCQAVKDEWEQFGKNMKQKNSIAVAAFNCDVYQDIVRNMRSDMVAIQSYPTMIVFRKGVPERQIGYGDRTAPIFERECTGLCH